MRNQLLCKRNLTLGVLITVLANAASGRGVINGTNQEGHQHEADHLRVDKILHGNPSRWFPKSASQPLSRIAKSIAFVKITNNDGGQARCGGTLIHKQWVLTAAHCVYDPPHVPARRFSVMVGNLDIRRGKYYEVDRVIIHDRYKREVAIPPRQTGIDIHFTNWFEGNDLALLKLREEVDTSKGNVKVAARLADGRESFDDEECVAAGWGLTELKVFPDHLMEWTIPKMISQSTCEEIHNLPVFFNNNWRERHICVFDLNNSRKGTCPGDSGGPLMCGPGHNILVGVAKSAQDCSNGKKTNLYPDIYTRVAPHLTWIYSRVPRDTKRPHNVV